MSEKPFYPNADQFPITPLTPEMVLKGKISFLKQYPETILLSPKTYEKFKKIIDKQSEEIARLKEDMNRVRSCLFRGDWLAAVSILDERLKGQDNE